MSCQCKKGSPRDLGKTLTPLPWLLLISHCKRFLQTVCHLCQCPGNPGMACFLLQFRSDLVKKTHGTHERFSNPEDGSKSNFKLMSESCSPAIIKCQTMRCYHEESMYPAVKESSHQCHRQNQNQTCCEGKLLPCDLCYHM